MLALDAHETGRAERVVGKAIPPSGPSLMGVRYFNMTLADQGKNLGAWAPED